MAITGASEDVQVGIGADSSELRDQLSSGIDQLTNFRTAVGLAGAALATLASKQLADAIRASGEFESSMANVEKVVGDVDIANQVGDEIRSLAEDIPLAHEQLAELATQAGRMGAESAEEIASFTEVAAQMGAATTLAADEAGTALGKMASSLNEPLDNVQELGDAINELSNSHQATSAEIVDSTQRAGQALSTFGLQSDEILGLSAAFNEVSPTSRLAATRMEQVGESLMDPGNVELFADMLGVSAEQFEQMREESPDEVLLDVLDAVDGNQDALDVLNDELNTAQARAFRDTADRADEMAQAMEMSGAAMEEGGSLANEVAVETDTLSGQMDLLRNRLRNVAIDVGDVFLPHIRDAVALLTRAVDKFAEFNEQTDGMAGAITLVVSILGGLTVAFGAVISALGGLTGAAAAASAAIAPLASGLSLLLGPVGLLILAVAALAAAWHTDFMGIQGRTQAAFDAIRDRISAFVEWMQPYIDQFTSAIQAVWERHGADLIAEVRETLNVLRGRFDTILTFITENIVRPALDIVSAIWDTHGKRVMAIVDFLFTMVKTIFAGSFDAILTVVRTVLALIRGDWDQALELITGLVNRQLGRIEQLFGSFKTMVTTIVSGLVGDVIDLFWELFDILVGNSILPDLVDAAIAVFKQWVEWISNAWDIAGAVGAIVSDVKTTVIQGFNDLVSAALGALSDLVSDALSMGGDAADNFKQAFNNAIPSSVSIPSRSVSIPEVLGGGSVSIGGGSLDLPKLASGGRVTGPGLAMVGERGDELVLNDEQTADADKGGVTVGDVEEDVRAALQESDRTDELLRRLDDLIRVVSQLSAGDVSQQDILEALEIARDRSGGRDPLADR